MLRALSVAFSILTFAIYAVITGRFVNLMFVFLGFMMLVSGISDRQKKKKRQQMILDFSVAGFMFVVAIAATFFG